MDERGGGVPVAGTGGQRPAGDLVIIHAVAPETSSQPSLAPAVHGIPPSGTRSCGTRHRPIATSPGTSGPMRPTGQMWNVSAPKRHSRHYSTVRTPQP